MTYFYSIHLLIIITNICVCNAGLPHHHQAAKFLSASSLDSRSLPSDSKFIKKAGIVRTIMENSVENM